jgi:hypothetical protein
MTSKQKLIDESATEIEKCKAKAEHLVEPLAKEEKLLEKMFEGIKGIN